MFQEPGQTEFDLRFRLLGVPVRIHPLFWVATAVLANSFDDGTTLVTWIACVFASILVHEFGHALVARLFGAQPHVVLYGMGGLAIYEKPSESLRQRFFVLIMGPGAGFLLFLATMAVTCLWLGISPADAWHNRFDKGRTLPSPLALRVIIFLTHINLYWGLVNLLPIMPLDGGQIATIFLTVQNPREGRRRGYILSMVTAGVAAIFLVRREDYFLALAAGLLALMSFQALQVMHLRTRFGGSVEDDADWWKR